jgi:acetolactate synthase-1/2/3 large subunit
MKYSDRFIDLLVQDGYTTVFYVAGGNIMHLLDSCRTRLTCVPVVHEVSAVIAAEYFNESSSEKAFALVTAGPGLTNAITGIAGAWLESRSVLVVGGQVKSSDLMGGMGLRQNGIQEINGVEIVRSICKVARRIDQVIPDVELRHSFRQSELGRPGPVFLEFCLDIQGADVEPQIISPESNSFHQSSGFDRELIQTQLIELITTSKRPVVLLGGGVSREISASHLHVLENLGIPIMTTWNGADRIGADHPLYFGRPNTWGQRSSNIILQQADLVLCIGSRLGLQQTGFNWESFVPYGKVIQVDIDPNELNKFHPDVALSITADSVAFFECLEELKLSRATELIEWLDFAREVRRLCPLNEPANTSHSGYVNPYDFVEKLSECAPANSIVIPCSSGGAFTTMMQAFIQKKGQTIITNKGLASMGYGLAGAIGAAVANQDKTVILVEGDGGFSQNLQEIGTVAATSTALKIFIYSNEGYASIRMTQKNYFNGAYMGCDVETGLGLPKWASIFEAYGIPCLTLNLDQMNSEKFLTEMSDGESRAYIVPIHPEQSYFPKISSSIGADGKMTSDPLHLMQPPLPESTANLVFRYT